MQPRKQQHLKQQTSQQPQQSAKQRLSQQSRQQQEKQQLTSQMRTRQQLLTLRCVVHDGSKILHGVCVTGSSTLALARSFCHCLLSSNLVQDAWFCCGFTTSALSLWVSLLFLCLCCDVAAGRK
jgi:predicted ribonuclease YlaK